MGDGSAWGGRLPCKQELRSVRFRYPPPTPSNVRNKGTDSKCDSEYSPIGRTFPFHGKIFGSSPNVCKKRALYMQY